MTPVFSAFQSLFSDRCRALRAATAGSRHQFQALFGGWRPPGCLAQADEGPHSRQRQRPLCLVFWTFRWQIAPAGASCREAIRQAPALCLAQGHRAPPDEAGPYGQARSALPLERLDEIHRGVVGEAARALGQGDLWQGRRGLVVDGATVTAPDTRANQKRFPQQSVQAPGCGFPILRIVARMSLATGLLVQWSVGPRRSSELGLPQSSWDVLKAGAVLLGDRLFCA